MDSAPSTTASASPLPPATAFLNDAELLNVVMKFTNARELTLPTSKLYLYTTAEQVSVMNVDEAPVHITPPDALNELGLRIYNAATAQLGDGSSCATLKFTNAVFLPESGGLRGQSKRPLPPGISMIINNLTNVALAGRVDGLGDSVKCGPLVMCWPIRGKLYGALTCAGELVLAEKA